MMIGALILSPYASVLATPSIASANQSDVNDVQRELADRASEKIDEEVVRAFRQDQHVSVLIEMEEQVDTAVAAQQGLQSVGSNATPHQQQRAISNSVYNALRSTATDTQAATVSLLEAAEEEGNVIEYEGYYIMNVVAATLDRDTLRTLSYRPEISRIKLDEFIELDLPEVSSEEIEATDDNVEWNIDRIGAPDVWDDIGVTGEGITVGIIDSGTDWTHEALQENWRGYNPDDPENSDPYGNWFDAVEGQDMPYDLASQPHGSHVMGTILGQGPDDENKIGVAPDANWISARAFSALGGTQSDLLASGQYMLAPEDDPSLAPDIVNNSWGGQPGVNDWYRPMVQAWKDSGIMPTFSAGNSGPGDETVTPPANYPESYAVAATDINDAVASFSSRGPSQYEGDQKPNVSAPGVNIRSSVPGGYEAGWNGTSMAAPHIAGTAALLLSTDSGLTPNEIEAIIDETADPLTDSQYTTVPNDAYGVGMVNAYEAVASIAGNLGSIEGSVLQEGSDDLPPEIEHSPLESVFAGYDVPITATITDDVSVTDAEVWMTNDEINHHYVFTMEQVSGDHEEGTYRAVLPANLLGDESFEYFIQASDYGNNVAQTERYSVEVDFGVTPDNYSEDFESEPIGWVLEGDWEWGSPEVGPEPVNGENLVGTNLSGNYSDDEHVLYSVPIDLRDAETASLRLNEWREVISGVDYANVLVSDDYGDHWEQALEFTGNSDGWQSLYVDLDDYVGSEAPVLVAFVLESNSATTATGWYLDNVHLVGEDVTAPSVPENLDVTSSTAGLQLDWDAPVDEELDLHEYTVYRATDDEFDSIATTSSTTFQDLNVEGGTEYTYVVTASDYDGNESDPSNEVSAVAPNITVFYHNTFQEDDGGFESGGTNSSWEWGEPTSGPNEALTGERLWATNLSGNYNNAEDSYIGSPIIELDDVDLAELHVTHWQDIENNWDYGFVQVSSDDGETWDELAEFTGRDQAWAQAEISLNDYLGESIQIRFAFDSDSIIAYPGWYIDEVTVVGTSEDVEHVAENDDVKAERPSDERIERELEQVTNIPAPDGSTPYEESDVREETSTIAPSVSGLPVSSAVTVLETNRSATTNPATGTYRINHSEGTYTVEADAYGFYSEQQEVTVQEGESSTANFMLTEIPTGEITGTVVNERNDEPVEDATVRVVEDPAITDAITDEDGNFTLEDVLEGEYTIAVSAPSFHSTQMSGIEVVGGEATEVTVEMRPFIGFDDEIAYDNGNAENAVVLNAANNGMAVQFTPSEAASVNGVNLYVWGDDFPVPGGTETQIAVYDTDGEGNPTTQLVEPFEIEVERGAWNYVDLSEYGVVTDRDFFVTTIQTQIGDLSPAVGTDMSSNNAERSYLYVSGSFEQELSYGNFMIRADVSYELEAPVIETPEDMTYTNEESIVVEGSLHEQAEAEMVIYNNEEEVTRTEAEAGSWSAEVDLTEGENVLVARAEVEDGLSDPSDPVTVIKDTVDPVITIESPEDGEVTNREAITVTGTVEDENLDSLTINEREVEVSEDGAFSQRLLLDLGENEIVVEATDLAGNVSTKQVTVYAGFEAPTIENVQPAEDVHLNAGETVQISFDSVSGLDASFVIQMPLVNLPDHVVELPMRETSEGHYVGYWTAISNAVANGAVIELRATDQFGNEVRETADGKLFINVPSEEEPAPAPDAPRAEFTLPNSIESGKSFFLDASNSVADGEIVNYSWAFGDGERASGEQVNHTYLREGTYTVTLGITDEHGQTDVVTKRIHATGEASVILPVPRPGFGLMR